MSDKVSRRGFLRAAGVGAGGVLLAACTPKVVKETVLVEKEVEKEVTVEKVVKETVVVEPTPMPLKVPDLAGYPNYVSWPIVVDEPLTYEIYYPMGARLLAEKPEDHLAWIELEKASNIKIEFIDAPSIDIDLLVASGDLPDMIWFGCSPAQSAELGMAGVFAPLDDLIDANAPNLKYYLDNYPLLKGCMVAPDGKNYCLPKIMMDYPAWGGWFMREDWLDEVGGQVPDTTDDFYELLKAFKERDPDCYPLIGDPENIAWNWGPPIGPNYGVNLFFVNEGRIEFGPLDPRWIEGAEFVRKLYTEELVPPDYASLRGKGSKATNFAAGVSGVTWGWFSHIGAVGLALMTETGSDVKAFIPPKGPYGDREYYSIGGMLHSNSAAIFSDCPNKAELMQYIDFHFSHSGALLHHWGLEGVHYDVVDGHPQWAAAHLKMLEEMGLTTDEYQAGYVYCIGGPEVQDADASKALIQTPGGKDAADVWNRISFKGRVPEGILTREESDVIRGVMTDVNTLIHESTAEYITGAKPLAEHDQLMQTAESAGIEKAQAAYQAMLDRYNRAILG